MYLRSRTMGPCVALFIWNISTGDRVSFNGCQGPQQRHSPEIGYTVPTSEYLQVAWRPHGWSLEKFLPLSYWKLLSSVVYSAEFWDFPLDEGLLIAADWQENPAGLNTHNITLGTEAPELQRHSKYSVVSYFLWFMLPTGNLGNTSYVKELWSQDIKLWQPEGNDTDWLRCQVLVVPARRLPVHPGFWSGTSCQVYFPFLPLFSFFLVLEFGGYCGICRILVREKTSHTIFLPSFHSEVLSSTWHLIEKEKKINSS